MKRRIHATETRFAIVATVLAILLYCSRNFIFVREELNLMREILISILILIVLRWIWILLRGQRFKWQSSLVFLKFAKVAGVGLWLLSLASVLSPPQLYQGTTKGTVGDWTLQEVDTGSAIDTAFYLFARKPVIRGVLYHQRELCFGGRYGTNYSVLSEARGIECTVEGVKEVVYLR